MNAVCRRLQPFGESVFSTASRLAVEYAAVNLSQGFPDFDGPDWLKEAAVQAVRQGPNQYAVSAGNPALRVKLAEKMQRESGLSYDPDREITVLSGATEAIAACMLGLLNPGDRVLLLEPFYDSYPACVAMAGAEVDYLPLQRQDLGVDWAGLRALLGPATRLLVLNTPGNPHGKVWSLEELEQLAQLLRGHPNLLVMTDEVYEHIVFAPARHHTLASLPDMRERTLVVSSFSKTLSMTGWKVGYVFAPAALTSAVRASHQFLTFCSASPLQAALAASLERLPEYLAELRDEYQARRDYWCEQLEHHGLPYRTPQGSYFVLTDLRECGIEDDREFCNWLVRHQGVAAIPAGAFYHSQAGKGLVRWAFCKSLDTLREASRRLAGWREAWERS